MYCYCAVFSEVAKTTYARNQSVSRCVRPWIKLTLEYPYNVHVFNVITTKEKLCVCVQLVVLLYEHFEFTETRGSSHC